MQPTRLAMKLGSPLLTALTAIACQQTPALEELPAGSGVTIEMQDGRRVAGTLVSVEPEAVVINGVRGDRKVRVTRANIAEVARGVNIGGRRALREVIVRRGSTLGARLDTGVASDASRVEEPIRATLAAPLVADSVTIAPAGSTLLGIVTSVRQSGRVRGRAEIGLRFDRLQTGAVTYDIRTAPMRWTAEATKGQDAKRVGVGAAAGAVIGAIAGGGKGAAVGSAIGAGGGSAVVLATRGEEIRLGSGTRLRVELTEAMSVMAPAAAED